MFDYTLFAVQKTYDDFKKFGYAFSVITQILYIAYLTYSIIAQAGRWWIKAIFLAISAGYFLFYLIVHHAKKSRLEKIGRKVVKRSKLVIKLLELVIAFYSIVVTLENATPASVILLASMICFWLLQVVFDIILSILDNRIQLFKESWQADMEEMKRPIEGVSNFVKKLTGKPIEPKKEKSKQRLWLDEQILATRKEKQESKIAKKQAKITKMAEEKAQKEQQRLQAKQMKNARKDALKSPETRIER